jgi:hypothetical protein
MTRWSAITRTRGRRSALAYGSRSTTAAEDNLNRLVHHDPGRYWRGSAASATNVCVLSHEGLGGNSGVVRAVKVPSDAIETRRIAVEFELAIEDASDVTGVGEPETQSEVLAHHRSGGRARQREPSLRNVHRHAFP